MWTGWSLLAVAAILMVIGVFRTPRTPHEVAITLDIEAVSLLTAATGVCAIAYALTTRIIRRMTQIIALFTQDIAPSHGRHQLGSTPSDTRPHEGNVTDLHPR